MRKGKRDRREGGREREKGEGKEEGEEGEGEKERGRGRKGERRRKGKRERERGKGEGGRGREGRKGEGEERGREGGRERGSGREGGDEEEREGGKGRKKGKIERERDVQKSSSCLDFSCPQIVSSYINRPSFVRRGGGVCNPWVGGNRNGDERKRETGNDPARDRRGKQSAKHVRALLRIAGSRGCRSRRSELQDHSLVPVKTTSREDGWAIKLVNILLTVANLRKGWRVRECPVFGVLEGVFVFGIIDQLNYTAKGELQLNELKTREKAYMPGPAQKKRDRFQVSLYKYLIDAMVQGCLTQDIFIHHLHLKPKQPLGQEIQEHAQKAGFVVHCFEDLLELVLLNLTHSEIPAIDHLQIEYIHQKTNTLLGTEVITYDHDELMSMSHYLLSYWKGQRDPKGVDIEDAWKCSYCAFVDICDWRQQRVDGLIQKGSKKKNMSESQSRE
ncbi:exonuclease V [Crotalus adamanteus]|uniref:Exonuclease V n=1 Tax=Crotalus adamanteus TaxID=8729 RepID=A0AAW1CDX7_CROAD